MSGSAETVVEKLHRLREEKAKKALEQEKTALAAAAATTEETNSTEPAKKRLVELGTPERDDNWVDADKKDTPIVNSKIYENRIFPVDPSHLVFAQYATYKAAPYFPGRICDYQEAITQGNIPAILTDNQVLVQFFVMDKNIFVVEKKKIRPYHCKAGEKAWDPERMQQIHKTLKKRLNADISGDLFDRISKTADSFLRLALEACAASTIDNGGIVEMKSKDEIPREKEEEVDLTHYASTRNKAKEVLRVGDYVWFNATVFKRRICAEVIGFTGDSVKPILLSTNDVLRSTDMLCLHQHDENGKCVGGDAGYSELGQFVIEPEAVLRAEATNNNNRTAKPSCKTEENNINSNTKSFQLTSNNHADSKTNSSKKTKRKTTVNREKEDKDNSTRTATKSSNKDSYTNSYSEKNTKNSKAPSQNSSSEKYNHKKKAADSDSGETRKRKKM